MQSFKHLTILLFLTNLQNPTTALPFPEKDPNKAVEVPKPSTITPTPLEPDDPITCASGLHIIIPRGLARKGKHPSNMVELRDLPALAKSIAHSIEDSNIVAIRYPHLGFNYRKEFNASTRVGAANIKKHVQKYVDTCGSDAKIALLGHGWGAAVVSDVFAGSGRNEHKVEQEFYDKSKDWKGVLSLWQPITTQLAPEYLKNVIVAVVFSSPMAFAREGYTRGTASSNGMYAEARGPLSVDAKTFRSYCDDGDYMCSEQDNYMGNMHGKVVKKYAHDAKKFVLEAWKNRDEERGDLEGKGKGDGEGSGEDGGDGGKDEKIAELTKLLEMAKMAETRKSDGGDGDDAGNGEDGGDGEEGDDEE